MGGFGNQLFTYAVAYAVAMEHQRELILDEQIYHTYYSLRNCEIHSLKIDYNRRLMPKSFGHNKVARKFYNIIHDILLKYFYRTFHIIEIRQFEKQEFKFDEKCNIYLTGYWQNYRYFDSYRADLIRQFRPNTIRKNLENLINLASEVKPIAMHVRRGDYKNFKGGKCLTIQYYLSAIDIYRVQKHLDAPIWIFTDDIEFCRYELRGIDNIFFASEMLEMNDLEEFYLMMNCANFIIANSSFSWWAAYLSLNINSTVVAPVVDMWKRDFYLPSWYTISANIE